MRMGLAFGTGAAPFGDTRSRRQRQLFGDHHQAGRWPLNPASVTSCILDVTVSFCTLVVLFTKTRVGKGSLPFTRIKFRTRVTDAKALRDEVLAPTRMPDSALTILRKAHQLGLGHAFRQTKRLIDDAPFAVLLPDDVIMSPTGALSQMVKVHCTQVGHMVATMEVPRAAVSSYGALDVSK